MRRVPMLLLVERSFAPSAKCLLLLAFIEEDANFTIRSGNALAATDYRSLDREDKRYVDRHSRRELHTRSKGLQLSAGAGGVKVTLK